MAVSRCPNCAFEYFEVVKNKVRNVEAEVSVVQCSSCGTVLGVVDDDRLKAIEERLENAEKISVTIDHNLRIIAAKLGIK